MRLLSWGHVAPFLAVLNLYNVVYAAPKPKHHHEKPNPGRIQGDRGWVKFKLTAYCPCAECCGKWAGLGGATASGMLPWESVTVAADRSLIPLWSILEIEGMGVRIVEDTGSAVKGRHLDVFVKDHETAKKFGVRYVRVRILQKGRGTRT